jgi:integrase
MAKRRSAGEGTIFWSEKSQRWIGQLTLPNGKKKTKKSKVQGEVKKWLLEQRKAVQDNTYIDARDTTLGAFLDRYMKDVAAHTLKPKTISSYTYIIEKHIKPQIGSVKLTELRPEQLQALYSEKMNSGLSRRTVMYIHQVLHKALNQALKWGVVARNVTEMADHPTAKRSTPEILSADQAKMFLEHLKKDRLYALYLLAIAGGFRQGELLGLHWEDVDLKSGQIHVNHTVQELRGVGLVISEPKTDSSRRTVPIPKMAVEALQTLYDASSEHKGLIFTTKNHTPFSQRNLLRHFHDTLHELGLPTMRFHTLRHTFASLMLSQNVHPKVVQEMLGHSTITLTLDTYSHLIPSMQHDASQKINDILS